MIADRIQLGFFPLQDFSAAQTGTPVGIRLSLGGARIGRFDNGPVASQIEYAKENNLGTLGDVHPWSFWQTRDRSVRAMGAWSQVFAAMVTDTDSRYAETTAVPIRDAFWTSDTRFADRTLAWPGVFPRAPKGSLLAAVAGTEEADQHNLGLWADPRLVAPNASGDGACGTLVVDLQPSDTLCMDQANSLGPGIGGRHARLQTLVRVIAVPPGESMGGLGATGNVVALNYSDTGSDGMPGYGAIYARAQGQGSSNGPITQRMGGWPNTASGTGGPINQTSQGTQRGSRTPETGYGFYSDRDQAGELEIGDGSFGIGFGSSTGGEEITLGQFGAFQPRKRGGHAVALMAAMPSCGPIHAGHLGDKHQLGVDRDGHPINSAHISTNAYFYLNQEFDGPLEFGGRYPYPPGFPLKSRVHLAYDSGSLHGFTNGIRQGKWRWWCEVPYFAPTTGNGDPRGPTTPGGGRPSNPGTGGPGGPGPGGPGPGTPGPGSPGSGRGPTTGGPARAGTPGPTTGSGRGGPAGPRPNNWGSGYRPTGGPYRNPPPANGEPAASPGKPGQGGPSVEPERPKGPITPGGKPPGGWKKHPTNKTRPDMPEGVPKGHQVDGYRPPPPRPRTAPPAREAPYIWGWRPQDKLVTYPNASPGLRRRWAREFIEQKQPTVLSWELGDEPAPQQPGPQTPARTPGPTTGPRKPLTGSCQWAAEILAGNPNQSTASETGNPALGSFYNPGSGIRGRTNFTDPRMSLGRMSGMDPWTYELEEVPGVVERVGTVDRDQSGLYGIFHPLFESYAAVGFRPQLHVAGYPHFLHNPQVPVAAIENDEALRPTTLSLFAFGGQSAATGDYKYVEDATTSRVRGGTASGGVVFTPPRFGLEDYYGVGSARNVDVTTGQDATTSYVVAAPGVCYALGKPNPDGTLKPQAVTMGQDATTALDIRHDGAQLFKGSKSGSAVIVELAQGGNSAVKLPYGTDAQRPTGATGLVRVSTQSATHALEFWDGTAWVQPSGGGGGLPTIDENSVLGRAISTGSGTPVQLNVGQNLYTYDVLGTKYIGAVDQEIVDGNYGDIDVSGTGTTWTIVENDYIIGAHWLFKECHNDSGSTITKGTPVYITGRTGDKINIAPADASNSAKMPAVGIVKDTVTNTSDGIVIVGGEAKLIDVGIASVGETLYVASGGGFTNVKPTYPNLVQNIGKVTKEGSSGTILVFGPGRTNDVPQLDNRYIFQGNASGSTITTKTPTLDALTLDAVANTTALTISGYSLTGANAQPAVSITGTWNTTGTPTALKLNVTNTASNSASLLMDLQVGGTSQFRVRRDGVVTGSNNASFGGTLTHFGTLSNSGDCNLERDATDVLAQRRSTQTQTFRVYNTFTDASNSESLEIAHATYSSKRVQRVRARTLGTGIDDISMAVEPAGNGFLTLRMPDGTATGGNNRGNKAVDLQLQISGATQVASGANSFAAGCFGTASGAYSVTLGAAGNASGLSSAVLGGDGNAATGDYAVATGLQSVASLHGQRAHSAGAFGTAGDAQASRCVLRAETVDSNSVVMSLDGSGSYFLTVPANTCWTASILISAREVGGANHASYWRRCCIENTGGTTALVGAVQTIGTDIETDASWTVTVTANDTTDTLDIEVGTPSSETTVRWVAEVVLVEVNH